MLFSQKPEVLTLPFPMIDTSDGSIRKIASADIGENEELCFSSGVLAGKYDEKCR